MRSRLFLGLTAAAASLGLCLSAAAMAAPDKNGITWDDPKTPTASSAPPTQLTAPPPGFSAPPASATPSSANLDNAGIIWNAPAKPGAPPPPAGIPAPPRTTTTAAVNAGGPCHEFQTTIVIDGRKQPAHGTVCQQADGSWHVVDK